MGYDFSGKSHSVSFNISGMTKLWDEAMEANRNAAALIGKVTQERDDLTADRDRLRGALERIGGCFAESAATHRAIALAALSPAAPPPTDAPHGCPCGVPVCSGCGATGLAEEADSALIRDVRRVVCEELRRAPDGEVIFPHRPATRPLPMKGAERCAACHYCGRGEHHGPCLPDDQPPDPLAALTARLAALEADRDAHAECLREMIAWLSRPGSPQQWTEYRERSLARLAEKGGGR